MKQRAMELEKKELFPFVEGDIIIEKINDEFKYSSYF